MLLNVFKPAPPGLTTEQLEARDKREKLILNALACTVTNAPMPDAFTLGLMQRFIDGEISLDEVEDLLFAEMEKEYNTAPADSDN